MSLSFLFSFLVVIACLCFRGTCPDAHLATLRYFWQTALAFLPGAKPTACTHRQPHQGLSLTSLKLTAGPLLRGIQAVLQELAGSATGGRGARGWLSSAGGRASRVATHPPPSCKQGAAEKICLLEPPSQQVILGSLRVSLYRNTGD